MTPSQILRSFHCVFAMPSCPIRRIVASRGSCSASREYHLKSQQRRSAMKVKDAMHKGVDWVSPDTPITEIAKLMRAHLQSRGADPSHHHHGRNQCACNFRFRSQVPEASLATSPGFGYRSAGECILGRAVFWRGVALLISVLLLGGCETKRRSVIIRRYRGRSVRRKQGTRASSYCAKRFWRHRRWGVGRSARWNADHRPQDRNLCFRRSSKRQASIDGYRGRVPGRDTT